MPIGRHSRDILSRMFLRLRILLCGALWSITWLPASGQATRYSVKLTPDFEHQVLRGEERIEFSTDAEVTEWQKKEGLKVTEAKVAGGEATVSESSVSVRVAAGGRHVLQFKYEAAGGQGLRWFAGPTPRQEYSDKTGFFTAFYCEAWMVCDTSPAQRSTLRLEIVIPLQQGGAIGFRAVGPGKRRKQWRGRDGDHFVFDQNEPVQTYLFSFGVARLGVAMEGNFSIYARDLRLQKAAFVKTADAYAFLRAKAGVDLLDPRYTQAFLPVGHAGFGQEAAGMALMSEEYLPELSEKDDAQLMAHELAHQWWGVLVGIRSWSDFWLNEGFAEFMSDAYIEKHQGRAEYEKQMAQLKQRMEKLSEEGKDRPLHWEQWKDAREALGAIPYVKGALFLNRLRTELGEEKFWRGIEIYTSRNARGLVDSRDFQRAMEEASGRDLRELFEEAVYH
jgi:aminopeptidase N